MRKLFRHVEQFRIASIRLRVLGPTILLINNKVPDHYVEYFRQRLGWTFKVGLVHQFAKRNLTGLDNLRYYCNRVLVLSRSQYSLVKR